jgi:hypothetical protein
MFSALTILPDEVLLLSVPVASRLDKSQSDFLPAPLVKPTDIPLPAFSHIPPSTIQGCRRWPYSLDAQSFSPNGTPVLMDILIHVRSYLVRHDEVSLACTGKLYSLGPAFGPLWFSRPWSPNRRRRWGFGLPSRDRTIKTNDPLPHGFIHFIWTFLTPEERQITTRTCSQWFLYHRLRCFAMTAPIASLKQLRPPPPREPNSLTNGPRTPLCKCSTPVSFPLRRLYTLDGRQIYQSPSGLG